MEDNTMIKKIQKHYLINGFIPLMEDVTNVIFMPDNLNKRREIIQQLQNMGVNMRPYEIYSREDVTEFYMDESVRTIYIKNNKMKGWDEYKSKQEKIDSYIEMDMFNKYRGEINKSNYIYLNRN